MKYHWTVEEDKILSEAIMTTIRNGTSQTNAFRDVSLILERTAQACKFRWQGNLINMYRSEISEVRERRNAPNAPSNRVFMGMSFDKKHHKRLKILSAINQIPMQSLIDHVIEEYLYEHWQNDLLEGI